MKQKRIGRFHIITDDGNQQNFSHIDLARMAIDAGADTIQYRDKTRGTREQIDIARAICELCISASVRFIVNDRTDVALAVDADGVHLGQRDLPIPVARRLLGPDKIIGGTAATLEEARRVQADGADYVGLGHVFATRTKEKSGPPIGLETLAAVCQGLTFPVVAIGGIDAHNVTPVLGTGVWGVAVCGAFCGSDQPEVAGGAIGSIITSSRGRPAR